MTKNKHDTKSNLAKLLATENISVQHKKVDTAYFDVKNRILCLPIWKEEMPDDVYDLLVGHEVGHALFCLLYTSPSPRDRTRSRMPSSA